MASGGDRDQAASGGGVRRRSSRLEVGYSLRERDPAAAEKQWLAAEKGGSLSGVLGPSLVTEKTIQGLLRDGKLSDPQAVRLPPADETEPHPEPSEAVVFVAFLDAGLRFPAAALVGDVLQTFGLELAQLTPNAVVRLAVYSWALRSVACWPSASLFAYLHEARCQPKDRKGGTLSNFGSVSFVLRGSCGNLFPANATRGKWESNWMKRWFYHRVASGSGLECTGRPIAFKTSPGRTLNDEDKRMAHRLVGVAARLNMRDLAEEFVMYGVAPLAHDWRLAAERRRDDNVEPAVCVLPAPPGPCKC